MNFADRNRKWLQKKSKRGSGRYPVGTLAFYGPDDRRASKVVAGIIPAPAQSASFMLRLHDEAGDVRENSQILEELVAFYRQHNVSSIATIEGIFGCPHEEWIDYPDGESCPKCPFWEGRDRFAPR